MRSLIFIVGMTFSLFCRSAELTEAEVKTVASEIKKMMMDLNTGNIKYSIKKTHPSLFSLFGDKKAYSQVKQASVKKMLASGIKFEQVTVGKPSKLYKAGNESVCFVPFVCILSKKDGKMKTTSYMVAIKKDTSKEWFYLEGSGLQRKPKELYRLLPKLPRDIVLPQNKKEILE